MPGLVWLRQRGWASTSTEFEGRRHCWQRDVPRKMSRDNITRLRIDISLFCHSDPVNQVRADLQTKSTLCAILHANYAFQEFGTVDTAHNKRYHLTAHAMAEDDRKFFSLV